MSKKGHCKGSSSAVYDQTAIDLKENFDKFMTYIHNPRKFMRENVEKYMLTERSKVLALIEGNIKVKEQRVSHGRSCQQNYEINRSLSNVSLLGMKQFRESPDEILIKHFCDCCWVPCPFCKAICTNTMEGHKPKDHNVPFHHPKGINGCHFKDTVEFWIDFCTTSVTSNAGSGFADWSNTPDLSELPYWKWFVCRFQEDLERYYDLKFQGKYVIIEAWVKVQCQVIFITAQVDLEPGYGKKEITSFQNP
uniref:Uncharacterized protein n=1 Tax=Salmo trutta TaxID=8032 RepID=A0A674BZT9_SALTR